MPRHLFVFAFLLAGACAHSSMDAQLIRRAGFDLDCAPEKVEFTEIDDRTRGAKGCGQRATYIYMCDTGANQFGTFQHSCTWVMNQIGGRPVTNTAK